MQILKKYGLRWLIIGQGEGNNLHVKFGYENDPSDHIVGLDINLTEKQNSEFYNSLIDYYLDYQYNN